MIGIELDTAKGKNSGSVNGYQYFKCPPLHGVFVKTEDVRLGIDIPPKPGLLKSSTKEISSSLSLENRVYLPLRGWGTVKYVGQGNVILFQFYFMGLSLEIG